MDMLITYTCPHINTCPIYHDWVEETGDDRLDIILKSIDCDYLCMAFDARWDVESGINVSDELRRRLPVRKTTISECLHIELLNLLNKKQDDRKTSSINA